MARLTAAWEAQGVPIVGALADGLSDGEMDEITAPLGLRLSAEARVWWGTHDGVPPRPNGEPGPERALGPGLQYIPLREAVGSYLLDREIFEQVEGDPEPFRPAAYFPVTRSTGPILCDCSVPDGQVSPIYYTHTYGSPEEELRQPAARSFGEMVGWWIDALTDGTWQWDPDRTTWRVDAEKLAPERELSGLM